MNTASETLPALAQPSTRKSRYKDETLTLHARRNFLTFLITLISALAYIGWVSWNIEYSYWYV
ncbi:MAG: hypothetical protein NTZ94_15995, partial [Verrucomicrobia bacterium]|nr:hypothetical protein [Verrucomicrobiota bacterium]